MDNDYVNVLILDNSNNAYFVLCEEPEGWINGLIKNDKVHSQSPDVVSNYIQKYIKKTSDDDCPNDDFCTLIEAFDLNDLEKIKSYQWPILNCNNLNILNFNTKEIFDFNAASDLQVDSKWSVQYTFKDKDNYYRNLCSFIISNDLCTTPEQASYWIDFFTSAKEYKEYFKSGNTSPLIIAIDTLKAYNEKLEMDILMEPATRNNNLNKI